VTWVTSSTPIDLVLEDELSGFGSLEYSFDPAGPWTVYDPDEPMIFSGQPSGLLGLHFQASDLAGNGAEASSLDIALDNDGPGILAWITPSAPSDSPSVTRIGPSSTIRFIGDDLEGVGMGPIEYRMPGTDASDWRVFDQPIMISDYIDDPSDPPIVEFRGVDLLGNPYDGDTVLTFEYDPVSPLPSAEGDLYFDEYTTESHTTISGRVPSEDVAAIHYRMDSGSTGRLPIEPNSTFDLTVSLIDGPNVLLYALEDDVGNISPWVVGGTIYRDNTPPTVISMVPESGTSLPDDRRVTFALMFTEDVTIIEVLVTIGGNQPVLVEDIGWTTMAVGRSILITTGGRLKAGQDVDLTVTVADLAGNENTDAPGYEVSEASDDTSMGFMFGLIAGLVLGIMLFYMATFKKKDEVVPLIDESPLPGSIMTPEERGEWAADEDEDDSEDDEPEESGDDIEEEDGPMDDTSDDEEDPRKEDEERETDDDIDDKVDDDMDDDIDSLLEDVASAVDEDDVEIGDLPDPDRATVDPGARF
jgi:hypothetical protein